MIKHNFYFNEIINSNTRLLKVYASKYLASYNNLHSMSTNYKSIEITVRQKQ